MVNMRTGPVGHPTFGTHRVAGRRRGTIRRCEVAAGFFNPNLNQTVDKRIIALLGESRAICDDCIATTLSLSRRQHANAECNRLGAAGSIVRTTEICFKCSRRKLTNRLRGMAVRSGFASPSKPIPAVNPASRQIGISLDGPTMTIMDYTFARVCALEPDRDEAGRIRLFTPRMDARTRGLQLHRYGEGPFCRFRMPSRMQVEGVYLIVVNDQIAYVGRCDRFSARFNMGYGQISARNCYLGGQSTNCRINRLIYEEAAKHK